jgi:hypothetical protein
MWTKKVDRKMLILRVLYELYQNNPTSEIKRAKLKEECDDRINLETNGAHEVYGGGSFEWCLKDLENKGLLERVHKKKKETIIVPNINRIEYVLQRDELESSLDKADRRVIETNVEDSILEEIIEEIYGKILDRVVEINYNSKPPESYYEIRNFIAKIIANMMSRAFDLNVSYDQSSKMQLNKELIKAIVTPIFEIVEHNLGSPFNIAINYKGLSIPSMEVLPRYEPGISQSFNNCFIEWVKSAYGFTISEEDEIKLREGNEKLLPKPASEYYNVFRSSAYQYLVLLLSKGHLVYNSD